MTLGRLKSFSTGSIVSETGTILVRLRLESGFWSTEIRLGAEVEVTEGVKGIVNRELKKKGREGGGFESRSESLNEHVVIANFQKCRSDEKLNPIYITSLSIEARLGLKTNKK